MYQLLYVAIYFYTDIIVWHLPMTNQKLYEFRVLVYCIIIKQMLLNKRTTSENTQYQQNVWEHACTKKDACVKLSSKPLPKSMRKRLFP